MATWAQYQSHKIVKAAVITSVLPILGADDHMELYVGGDKATEPFRPNEQAMADKAKVGDYAIVYGEGYKSVSPKAVSEDGYTPVSGHPISAAVARLRQLVDGKRPTVSELEVILQRDDMHVEILPDGSVASSPKGKSWEDDLRLVLGNVSWREDGDTPTRS